MIVDDIDESQLDKPNEKEYFITASCDDACSRTVDVFFEEIKKVRTH